MFGFKGKVAVVTGGARGIGKCICEKFREAGAHVCIIDLIENDYFTGDLSDKATLEAFAEKIITEHGKVDFLINNAAPRMCGIENGSYEPVLILQSKVVRLPRITKSGRKLKPFECTDEFVRSISLRERRLALRVVALEKELKELSSKIYDTTIL